VATDIASETNFSLWAVPLSIVGAIWSYYRRRNANIPVKFCIAIGMLVALGAFFGRFLGDWNDTRINLAQLLIELQVLDGYDTPRRKDLGYFHCDWVNLVGCGCNCESNYGFCSCVAVIFGCGSTNFGFRLSVTVGFEAINKRRVGQKEFYECQL
jgi:hypothetical protein